ncbi:MAG: gluconate 2-dehydrogenase subunit 3 family protein, partial [Roseicyclus sp.]
EALFDLDRTGREQAIQALSERERPIGDFPAGTFFDMLLGLANEGYFADPIYLGNHDYAGWRMVGFPGAHAYYLERVDRFAPSPPPPPRGIAHNPGGPNRPPRPIPPAGGAADG